MGYDRGDNGVDKFYMSDLGPLIGTETYHGYNAYGGDDIVYGSIYRDIIEGGSGNDILYGYDGDDGLIGQEGNDTMYGGNGNDFLHGGSADTGQDVLNGGAGNDRMWGGKGDDVYVHILNGGVDTINDGLSEASSPGYGGGLDIIQFTSISLAQLAAHRPAGSNDLWLSSFADFSDGQIDDGVIIQDFYLAEANTFIELAYTSDRQWIDLWQLI